MEADTHIMGNDWWTSPPFINIFNWIMRLNLASSMSTNVSLTPHHTHHVCSTHILLLHGKLELQWLNGVQRQICFECKECQTAIRLLCLQQRRTNWFGMRSAYTFAEKYGKRTKSHQRFSNIPEIQFQRCEYYFRIQCLDIKRTDFSKWGCGLECYF